MYLIHMSLGYYTRFFEYGNSQNFPATAMIPPSSELYAGSNHKHFTLGMSV